jgi:hypothetical protein
MTLDSPIGPNGLASKSNGIPAVQQQTAKVSEMISLYRPTKVSGSLLFQDVNERASLTDRKSTSVEIPPPQDQGDHRQFKALFFRSTSMMKEDFFSPLKVTIVCKYTMSKRGNTTRLI